MIRRLFRWLKKRDRAIRQFGFTINFNPYYTEKHLGLTPEKLKGKRVLYIGEGSGRFGEYCRNAGAKYFGLDAKNYLKKVSEAKSSVVGTAQKLPFKSDSIDMVLDHQGVLEKFTGMTSNLNHLQKTEVKKIIEEALRVGKTFISYPISPRSGWLKELDQTKYIIEEQEWEPYLLVIHRKE